MQPRWLSASVAMADSDYAINHVIHSLCLDVCVNNARRRVARAAILTIVKWLGKLRLPTIPEPFHNGKDRSAWRAWRAWRACGLFTSTLRNRDPVYIIIIIIITNSQTSRAARSLNSVVTSRGVPAYCVLLSIPRDHGTSTRVFRWRLCHEGLCVCLSWISLVE